MGIMDGVMPLPEPSQAIIDSVINAAMRQQELDYTAMIALVERWKELLAKIYIVKHVFTLHENKEMMRENDLMTVWVELDPLAAEGTDQDCVLIASFHKGGMARVDYMLNESKEILARYESFLSVEGTWEDVAQKIIELNDLVVAENTPPPIPDSLQE
jgi:hypothetical protein